MGQGDFNENNSYTPKKVTCVNYKQVQGQKMGLDWLNVWAKHL